MDFLRICIFAGCGKEREQEGKGEVPFGRGW